MTTPPLRQRVYYEDGSSVPVVSFLWAGFAFGWVAGIVGSILAQLVPG